MEDKNKQIIKISVFITSIFVILLSVSYAFINLTLQGEKKQVLTAGNLSLELKEDENVINISDALPMYDEVGMLQTPFTFRIINNVGTTTAYTLKLIDITTGDKLDTNIVKYGLTKNGVTTKALLSTLADGVIDSGTIGTDTIEYELRLWIDSSVIDNTSIKTKSLRYKLELTTEQIAQKDLTLFEWDGLTQIERVNADAFMGTNADASEYFVKISDTPLTEEQLLNSTLNITMEGYESESVTITEEILYKDDNTGMLYVTDYIMIVPEPVFQNNLVLSEGIWTIGDNTQYTIISYIKISR